MDEIFDKYRIWIIKILECFKELKNIYKKKKKNHRNFKIRMINLYVR